MNAYKLETSSHPRLIEPVTLCLILFISGGVLFSLEEGCSFWNQNLTWLSFTASVVSSFTLNFVLSYYSGFGGTLNYPGLLNFGSFPDLEYEIKELPIFLFLGMLGGLTGAAWNQLNYTMARYRRR